MIKASAPGGIILFGEHSVVYGETALATAFDKKAYATACELDERKIMVESKNLGTVVESRIFEETQDPVVRVVQATLEKLDKNTGIGIEIDSEIPVNVGLGSSASVVTAASAAVFHLFSNEVSNLDIAEAAYEAEKISRGKPSGIDTAITTFGRTISFKQGLIENLKVNELELVVGNTGIKKKTRELVERVRQVINDPKVAHSMFSIGSIVKKAKTAFLNKEFMELGKLMDKNHEYLRLLGVSSGELERLIKAAKKAGAYGAKLTGGGGGGCIIALTDNPDRVINALEKEGATAFIAKTNQEGVKIEL